MPPFSWLAFSFLKFTWVWQLHIGVKGVEVSVIGKTGLTKYWVRQTIVYYQGFFNQRRCRQLAGQGSMCITFVPLRYALNRIKGGFWFTRAPVPKWMGGGVYRYCLREIWRRNVGGLGTWRMAGCSMLLYSCGEAALRIVGQLMGQIRRRFVSTRTTHMKMNEAVH